MNKIIDFSRDLKLSPTAITDLKRILLVDIGEEALSQLSEEEVNRIGLFLLTLTDIQLNIRMREVKQKEIS